MRPPFLSKSRVGRQGQACEELRGREVSSIGVKELREKTGAGFM
jgi:hypothetical protein